MAFLVLWEEYKTGAIFAFLRHWNALQKNKLVWYLQKNTGSVACLVVGAFCSTVLHVFEHLQCGVYQFMRFVAVDVDEHAHTACVVFVR